MATDSDGKNEKGFAQPARLSYGSYLKVPELLELQHLLSDPPHHDELQFIIVHQTYELWFRLVLFELETVREEMLAGELKRSEQYLGRVRAIQRVLLQQIHVLETMTPRDFLGFRDHLRPASGFQSVQFRELEIVCGLRDERFLEFLDRENVPEVREAIAKRLAEPSLRQAAWALLQAHGFDVGYDAESGEWDDAKLRIALRKIHETLEPADVYRVLDALVEIDELCALWRNHHLLMVERVIGGKPGTGGSSGAGYLRSTVRYRFFPELWDVRGELAEG